MTGLRLTASVVQLPRRWRLWRHRSPDAAAVGRRGEDLAYWYLRRQGYTIVARNYRAASRTLGGAGEIDLIAFEGAPPAMVFVEVKTRAQEGRIAAERAVDMAKRQHLLRTAERYRARRRYTGPYRFDVVVIYGPDDAHPRVRLHRDAFRAAPSWSN